MSSARSCPLWSHLPDTCQQRCFPECACSVVIDSLRMYHPSRYSRRGVSSGEPNKADLVLGSSGSAGDVHHSMSKHPRENTGCFGGSVYHLTVDDITEALVPITKSEHQLPDSLRCCGPGEPTTAGADF